MASTDEYIIIKMWYSHTTKYYLVIKRNEVSLAVRTWMSLENSVRNKRGHTRTAAHHTIPVHEVCRHI